MKGGRARCGAVRVAGRATRATSAGGTGEGPGASRPTRARDRSGGLDMARASLRAMAVTSGRAALLVGGPTFSALALLSAIVFGPNGMSARDLVRAMRASPALGVAVGALWLALSVPAAEATLGARGLRALRSQPLSLGWVMGSQGALLVALALPWGLLMTRANEGLLAVVACLGALTASAALAALGVTLREAHPGARLLALTAGGAALTLAPPTWLALAGPLALAWAMPRAHTAGLCRPTRRRSFALPRARVLALGVALALGLVRGARARWMTALGLVALGLAASHLALARERPASLDEGWPWGLGVALVPIAAGLALLTPSLAKGASSLGGLVRASGAPPNLARVAALLVGGALGAAALAPVGASLARSLEAPTGLDLARALGGPPFVGAALGLTLVAHALREARRKKPELSRLVVTTCASLAVGLVALSLGDGATHVVSLTAALGLGLAEVRA